MARGGSRDMGAVNGTNCTAEIRIKFWIVSDLCRNSIFDWKMNVCSVEGWGCKDIECFLEIPAKRIRILTE